MEGSLLQPNYETKDDEQVSSTWSTEHEDIDSDVSCLSFRSWTNVSVDDSNNTQKRKKKTKFSHFVKAVMFELSLIMKIRKRKQELHKNLEDAYVPPLVTKSTFDGLLEDDEPKINSELPSSLFSSSIVASSPTLHSRSTSSTGSITRSCFHSNLSELKSKNMQMTFVTDFVSRMFLISLVFLVFWGKACAIFCTSVWLFLVPRKHVNTS